MLNVRTTPDKSRNIGYSINNLGVLKVNSLVGKAVSANSKLVTSGFLDKTVIVTTEFKPTDYWSQVASLVTNEMPPSEINISYSHSKAKSNYFDVKSRRLTV